MPTKVNRAGQQQNYVPAGNGDASGEYTDHEGSNRNFKSFKKPEPTPAIEETGKVENTFKVFKKSEEPTTEKVDNDNIESVRKDTAHKLIGKCNNPSRENDITFKDLVKDSNDESVKILNQYLGDNNDLSIRFGDAGRNAAGKAFRDQNIITNSNIHTIRHELGHTFDYYYGKNMEKDPNKFSFESNERASVRFVDKETGKTMNETIHEELGVSMYKATIKGFNIKYVKLGVDKRETKIAAAKRINEIFTKYGDKIFDEITGIKNSRERYKELQAIDKDIRWNLDKDLQNTEEYINYENAKKEVRLAEEEYSNKRFSEGAYSVNFSQSPEVVKAREKQRVAREKYEALKEKVFNEKFGEKNLADYKKLGKEKYDVYKKMEGVAGLVGDTFDYIGAGSSFYTTNGHGSYYFNNRKEAGYVEEIFANMFDCYMSKDTWKKDFVKEAFPKTAKIFDKIYYKKGKK